MIKSSCIVSLFVGRLHRARSVNCQLLNLSIDNKQLVVDVDAGGDVLYTMLKSENSLHHQIGSVFVIVVYRRA